MELEQLSLFDVGTPAAAPPAPPEDPVSAGRKLLARQAQQLARREHPLGGRLHALAAPADDRDAPGLRCGSCRFRVLINGGGQKNWPKCTLGAPEGKPQLGPRITNGAASDVRRWWPACTAHEPTEPAAGS